MKCIVLQSECAKDLINQTMSRTRRKPYTGSKAVDKSCRGKRGSCPTCSENRQHKNTKREIKEDYEIN